MSGRAMLLKGLLRFDRPQELEEIVTGLNSHGWDSDEILVALKKEDIISVLGRYLRSELSEQEVENWANAIELREDIGFTEDVQLAIFALANPVLEGDLTPQRAKEMIRRLQAEESFADKK